MTEKYINDIKKFSNMTLNRLVIPTEGIVVPVPPRETYVLVLSDLAGFDEPFDLAVDLVNVGREPQVSVVDNHYLVPYLYCVGMSWEGITGMIGESVASENPFVRYFIKTEERNDPFLYDREDFMLGKIFVGPKLEPRKYDLMNIKKIKDNNPPTFEKYRETLRQKQEIVSKFF